jgi:hypothetical protein
MDYPFRDEHDVLPSLLFIAHSSLTNPEEFESRFQELLNQRSQQIIPPPPLQQISPCDVKEIPKNDIMEFCAHYKENKEKLNNISKVLDKIEENKKIVNDAYKSVVDNLSKLIEFHGNNESMIDLLNNISELKTRAYDIVTKDEALAKEEHKKLCDYLSQCVDLFGLIKKTLPKPEGASQELQAACPVCFDKQVDSVYVPCGHTICKDCGKKVRNLHCIICRKKASMIPFYLSA